MNDNQPDFLPVGKDAHSRQLAVLSRSGKAPNVIWLGGFRSDMRATKAAHLDAWAERTGHCFTRFDYSGHGESSGDFAKGSIGQWFEDSLAVLEVYGGEEPLLVGSSMGGWLALLAAREWAKQAKKLRGLVLIAPAVDFTDKLMWDMFPKDVQDTIMKKGEWLRHSEYSPEPYPITRHLIEEGRKHLLLGNPMHIGAPIHILQGTQDPDVPVQHTLDFIKECALDDTSITLVTNGDHRLSRPQDLELLARTVEIAICK